MNIPNRVFWKNKRVFLTGHTGFKGSWLSIWLQRLGAIVTGYSLEPPTDPSLFHMAHIGNMVTSIIGDVRDYEKLNNSISVSQPDVVLHLAAQPLVRDSYRVPVETYSINVMGTVNLFEAIRQSGQSVQAVINVTTDKVYDNREWEWGYRECEPLGGYDPYSNSKACSELVTAAYRNSFFNPSTYSRHHCAVASARAGNVIGGGDWATDRIVPDCIRAFLKKETVVLRNPQAVRPWQHVLEPLCGYLLLAQCLCTNGISFAEGWNFGPRDTDCVSVGKLVGSICNAWGESARYTEMQSSTLHEANFLKLDCSKAIRHIGWQPRWNLQCAVEKIVNWYKGVSNGLDALAMCEKQIEEFESATVFS